MQIAVVTTGTRYRPAHGTQTEEATHTSSYAANKEKMPEPQAQNEELLGANRELQARVDELTRINNELLARSGTLGRVAEEVRSESEERQAFLLKLSDALRPLADAVEIQEVASRLLGERLNADRVYYCEISDNVVIIHRDYAPGVPSIAGKYPFEVWRRRLMEAYYRGENLAIEDVHTHPMFAGEDLSAYDAAGFTSGILVSLPKRPDWGAMLAVTSRVPRTWTRAEVRLAEEAAERTWAAVERASIEEALRESEARFRAVADLVPDLLWSNDPQGVTNWYNQRWYEYTGQSFEEAQGYGWLDAIHPDDREQSLKNVQETINAGEPLRLEHRIRASNGSYRWFLARAEPVRDENGRIVRWFGAATDIHEERMAREELERRVAERTAELARANQALRRLPTRMLEVQEEERRRITRELHEEIGQYLAGLKLMIGEVKPESEVMVRRLAAIQEVLTDLAGRVSTLSLDLRPPMLDDMGLLPALLWYVQRYTERTGIEVDFRHMGLKGRLPAEVETMVYRVAQEALTNAANHSGANHVTLQVLSDSKITIVIEDGGKGFDAQQAPAQYASTGISAMRERVELVGGQFAIESSPGRGTTVIVEIPTHPDPT